MKLVMSREKRRCLEQAIACDRLAAARLIKSAKAYRALAAASSPRPEDGLYRLQDDDRGEKRGYAS